MTAKHERENARNASRRASKAHAETLRRLRDLDDPGPSPSECAPMQRSTAAGICGVCTDETPAGAAMRPLGRDYALVIVCADCDGMHPRDGSYSFDEATASSRPTARGNEGNRRRGTTT